MNSRQIRRILGILLVIVLIATVLINFFTGMGSGMNPVSLASALFLAVVGLLDGIEFIREHFGEIPGEYSRPRAMEGTVEGYLIGREKVFKEQEKLFVDLQVTIPLEYRVSDKPKGIYSIRNIMNQDKGRFVLTGNPGGGKSTTLRNLMLLEIRRFLKYYREHHREPMDIDLPLWINLGLSENPTDAGELIHFWWNKYQLPDTPDAYIRDFRLALFLDGLNEMPLNTRRERAESLRKYISQLSDKIPVIVTCRIRDYEEDSTLKLPLPEVRISPLDAERVDMFMSRRLPEIGVIGLRHLLHTRRGLREMADNPYNLAMLIEVYRNGSLPANLNELYAMYVERAYLDNRRRYTDVAGRKELLEKLVHLEYNVLIRRLRRLAFRMLAYGGGTAVSLNWLRRPQQSLWVGTQAIRDGINLGVLVVEGSSLRFYHQQMHGFFAIDLLTKAINVDNTLDRFTKNPVAFMRQISDLGEAGAPAVPVLIMAMSDREPLMYEAAAVALGKIKDPVSIHALVQALGDSRSGLRSIATRVLAQAGEPAVPPLIESLMGSQIYAMNPAAEALSMIGSPALPAVIQMLRQENLSIRHLASEIVSGMGESTVEPLAQILKNPAEPVDFRVAVATTLARIPTPAVIPVLVDRLQDKKEPIRLVVVRCLQQLAHPDTVPALIERLNDPSPAVQQIAVAALRRINTHNAHRALREYQGE